MGPWLSPSQQPAPTASHVSKLARVFQPIEQNIEQKNCPAKPRQPQNCERRWMVVLVAVLNHWVEGGLFHRQLWINFLLLARGGLSTGSCISGKISLRKGGICRRDSSGCWWSIVHSLFSTVFLEHSHVRTHNYLGLHVPNEALDRSQEEDPEGNSLGISALSAKRGWKKQRDLSLSPYTQFKKKKMFLWLNWDVMNAPLSWTSYRTYSALSYCES